MDLVLLLLQTVVEFAPQNVCNEKYSPKTSNIVDARMICPAKPSQLVCNGDSGGPLIVTCERTREDLLVGIVPWGFACASVQFPAIYVKVSYAFSFIENIVQQQGHSLRTVTFLS